MNRQLCCLAGISDAPRYSACGVSDDQEVSLGKQNSDQINAQLPLVTDPLHRRLCHASREGDREQTSRADLDWHFYVVNTPEVNAFALPGGFIDVNRGLIERTERLDQLAGTLGHEIGHVVRRHSVEQMKKATGANVGITLVMHAHQPLRQPRVPTWPSMSRDRRSSRSTAAGRGRGRLGSGGQRRQRRDRSGRRTRAVRASAFANAIAIRTALDGFFASHPFEENRVEHTRS